MTEERAYQASLSALDSSLATALRETLAPAGEEIIAAIRESVPDYSLPLEGTFGRNVRTGVGAALTQFVDTLERPGEGDPEDWHRVYFNLGRGEVRAGRTLEALLAAYRVGARVAWRRVADAASAAGAGTAELTGLAEAIFAYIDELSAISAEGFAAEQAAAAGEAQRRRERLVRLLIEGEEAAGDAAAAGWRMPRTAAALVAREERAAALASRLGEGVIARQLGDGVACAIVPDADAPGRANVVAGAVRSGMAALGPDGPIAALPRSFELARRTLDLTEAGVISGAQPVRAADHLATLALHRDPELLAEHARSELAPLDELTERSRASHLETLEAWLEHPGRPTEVARAVHVHPQTARYRLRRLRELLGDIDDPDRRFSLQIAVRAR